MIVSIVLRSATTLPLPKQDYYNADNPYAREMGWWGVTAPWRADSTTPLQYFSKLGDTLSGTAASSQSPPLQVC